MIEVWFNDKLLDIPADEVIALNKQVNDIGELALRKSDFTRAFKVKRTRETEALFENAGLITSSSEIPYSENSCMFLSNGLEQIPSGRLNIIKSDDDFYHVNIYSGAKNVFDDIGKLTLNDLNLSDLIHTWDYTTAASSVKNDLYYQYLLFDPSDDGGLIPDAGDISVDAEILRPFVKLKRIWDQIWTDQGITAISDIDADPLFLKMFQQITTLKPTNYNLSGLLGTRFVSPNSYALNVWNLLITSPLNDPSEVGYIGIKVTGMHYFSVTIPSFYLLSRGDYDIKAKVNGVDVSLTLDKDETNSSYTIINFSMDLVAGDSISFYISPSSPPFDGYVSLSTIYVNCYNIDFTAIGYSSTVDIAQHLDGMKQSDFVKGVCNFFSLIPSYDQLTNTITFWSLNRILKNKIVAKDWSKYLSVEDTELSFTLKNYAQKNSIIWKENEDVPKSAGNYDILTDAKGVEKEKIMITLPISFSDEIIHQSQRMARIGWFKTIEGSADYNKEESVATRWVTSEFMTMGAKYSRGGSYESLSSSEARQAQVLNLAIGNNTKNYQAVIEMARQPKVLTAKFNLPAKEVQSIDHAIPIFLEQYSSYFYLNSVKNWIDGYMCECELIKI